WITYFFKRAIPFVYVEQFRCRVIDDNQIEQIVFIDVNECGGEAVEPLRIAGARLDAHVFKSSVGLLMIQSVVLAFESSWTAHNRRAAKLAEVLRDRTRPAGLRWTGRWVVDIEFEIAGD